VNAKVTTWWKTSKRSVTQTMPESSVQRYLDRLDKDLLKGYIVDATPPPEVFPEDAVIHPFTVEQTGKLHAAFIVDYRTDEWFTHCGKKVQDPSAVVHKMTAVECPRCKANLGRG
jgi:hypothetical protein